MRFISRDFCKVYKNCKIKGCEYLLLVICTDNKNLQQEHHEPIPQAESFVYI